MPRPIPFPTKKKPAPPGIEETPESPVETKPNETEINPTSEPLEKPTEKPIKEEIPKESQLNTRELEATSEKSEMPSDYIKENCVEIDGKIVTQALAEGLSDSQLTKYAGILKDAHGRDFSIDEVRNLLTLGEGASKEEERLVADFKHIDSDMVAAARSPVGFGQIIVRKNAAKLLKPLYEYLGADMEGIQFNNRDMDIMAGSDMDADMPKVIVNKNNAYGVDFVGELLEYQRKIEPFREKQEKQNISVRRAELAPVAGENVIDNPEVWKRQAGLQVKAPEEMGYYSGIGSRLSILNFDSFSPSAKMIARVSMKGNKGYDYATTNPKKPGETIPDSEMMKALGLGYEYQKLPGSIESLYNVKATSRKNIDGSEQLIYTTLDESQVINPEDVFETSGKRLINLSTLRNDAQEGK